jgi:hypothetical protein
LKKFQKRAFRRGELLSESSSTSMTLGSYGSTLYVSTKKILRNAMNR